MIDIPKYIEDLIPYRAGKPIDELKREMNLKTIVKLASNENPLGASPEAIKSIASSLEEINRYTDPTNPELIKSFSDKLKIKSQHIVFGHGTDSIIIDIINSFSKQGDEILTSDGTFIGIYVSTKKLGRILKTVPMKNYGYDLKAIKQAISSNTKIIYLANPNNPTGSMIEIDEFEDFMLTLPKDILVLLDEAYYSYAEKFESYPDGLRYNYENMVVIRTLSKIYGLGGMRIGFAVGPERLISTLKKVRLPFEPNYLAQKAAMAALYDENFVKKTVELNTAQLKKLTDCFERLKVKFVKPHGNFVMILLPNKKVATNFNEQCLNRGLILRHLEAFGIENGIRINSGTEKETDFAIKIFEDICPKLISNKEEIADETGIF